MASIGLHRGRYQVRIRRNGEPTISRKFSKKKDAIIWAASTERQIEQGIYQRKSETTDITLSELLSRYEQDVTPKKRSKEIETLRIKKIKRSWLASIKLKELRSFHIAKFRDERLKEAQGNAVARDLSLISHAIDVGTREWSLCLEENPVLKVTKPVSNPPRDRRLEFGEEQLLLEGCSQSQNPYLKHLVVVAIETAMRRGELLKLEWKHINLKDRTAYLPTTKNGSPRTVPLSTRAIQELKTMPIDITGRVFPLSQTALRGLWCRTMKRTGLKNLRLHDLRHEATTRFFELGLNVMEVSTITGHKDLRMLKRYTHIRAKDLAKKLG